MKIEFAIVDANTLSGLGLKHILEGMMPMAEISVFHSQEELVMADPERFIHYFVASGIFFEHAQYFIARPQRSIVLVQGNAYPHIAGLLTINVCQDEKEMLKSLLQLHERGLQSRMMHAQVSEKMPAQATPPPDMPSRKNTSILSSRETEVAVLLAKGLINKEIADRLSISLTTVISHRKNIMEKLNARSLADIIIYVVMNGVVSVEEL